jgi:hypothetical protein
VPLFLYPFLNTVSKTRPFEYLRLTSLGVIGALVKVDDTEVGGWRGGGTGCGWGEEGGWEGVCGERGRGGWGVQGEQGETGRGSAAGTGA